MDLLSYSDETRIFKAAQAALREAGSGTDPSEAVAKYATVYKLVPEMTKRAVEAFNVSRTANHLKTAPAIKKAESVDLADTESVFSIMYPSTVKTPSVETHKSALFSDTHDTIYYDEPAPETIKGDLSAKSFTDTPDADWFQALRETEHIKAAAGIIKDKKAEIHYKLVNAIQDAVDYFRPVDAESFSKCADYVMRKTANNAFPLLNEVYEESKLGEVGRAWEAADKFKSVGIEKLAEAFEYEIDTPTEGIKKLAGIVELARQYCKISSVDTVASNDAGNFEEVFDMKSKKLLKKKAFIPSSIVGGVYKNLPILNAVSSIGQGLTDKYSLSGEDIEDVFASSVTSGVRDTENNIRATMLLNDFLRNDEVLSAAPPEEVVRYFNKLMESYPDLLKAPMVVKSVIRKAVESGGLDMYDLSSVGSMASDVAKTERDKERNIIEKAKVRKEVYDKKEPMKIDVNNYIPKKEPMKIDVNNYIPKSEKPPKDKPEDESGGKSDDKTKEGPFGPVSTIFVRPDLNTKSLPVYGTYGEPLGLPAPDTDVPLSGNTGTWHRGSSTASSSDRAPTDRDILDFMEWTGLGKEGSANEHLGISKDASNLAESFIKSSNKVTEKLEELAEDLKGRAVTFKDLLMSEQVLPYLTGASIGSLGAGTYGYMSSDKIGKDRLMEAVRKALMGSAAGAAGGHLYKHLAVQDKNHDIEESPSVSVHTDVDEVTQPRKTVNPRNIKMVPKRLDLDQRSEGSSATIWDMIRRMTGFGPEPIMEYEPAPYTPGFFESIGNLIKVDDPSSVNINDPADPPVELLWPKYTDTYKEFARDLAIKAREQEEWL